MKNTILIIAALIGIATTSCRKERTCKCKTTSTTATTSNGATITEIDVSSDEVTKEKQTKKSFAYQTNCFSTTWMEHDSGTFAGQPWSSETTNIKECEIK